MYLKTILEEKSDYRFLVILEEKRKRKRNFRFLNSILVREEERDHPCGENEEGEEVDFSILKSLPELYIDSDSAMVIASEMGGDDFLDYYSGDEDSEYSGGKWSYMLYMNTGHFQSRVLRMFL